jgi:hypothetical protein
MALRSIKRRPPASSPSPFGGAIVAGIGGTIITGGGAGERTPFNAARRNARTRRVHNDARAVRARLNLASG